MLFLAFEIGGDRYALDVQQVVAVLPMVTMTPVPQAPAAVAGVFSYRGTPVPAIDLSRLALGRTPSRRLSTRIVLVDYPDASNRQHRLGLVAERATETMRRDASDFVASGVTSAAAPWLGPVATDACGLIRLVRVEALLPASVRELLFNEAIA